MRKVFDIKRFCRDYRIPYDDSGSEVTAGWINLRCPFCKDGEQEFHLGVSTMNGSISCWRCGRHKLPELLHRIARKKIADVSKYVLKVPGVLPIRKAPELRGKTGGVAKTCQVPTQAGPLADAHRRYLEGRKFDPDALVDTWGLLGTGPFGDYKYRIIAPIYLDYELVSYQGRDITGKQELRYKACKRSNEALNHKFTLYGIDLVPDRKAVIVEGITDAWRLGPGSVATFGTAYTKQQEMMIAERLDTIYLFFDSSDDHAKRQMEELGERLSYVMPKVEMITAGWKDPGSAPQDEANALMWELGFGMRIR